MHKLYELINADFVRIDDASSEVDRTILEKQLEQECRLNEHVYRLYEQARNGSGKKIVIEIKKTEDYQEASFKIENPDGNRQEIKDLPNFKLAKDKSELTIDYAISRISDSIRQELDNSAANPCTYSIKSVKIRNFAPDTKNTEKSDYCGLADIDVELEEKPVKQQTTTLANYWDTTINRILKQSRISPGRKTQILLSLKNKVKNLKTIRNIELLHKILAKIYENPDSNTKDWYRINPNMLKTEEPEIKNAHSVGVCNLFERIFLDKQNAKEIEKALQQGESCKLELKCMLIAYKR